MTIIGYFVTLLMERSTSPVNREERVVETVGVGVKVSVNGKVVYRGGAQGSRLLL